ncbi:MAG: hypothetical protein KTR31_19025 [Myxococcales bacterium]|nr:hypothetical protein [Myxococcales bacterium]
MDALTDLAARREAVDLPPLAQLCGRFHSHVTVRMPTNAPEVLEALHRVARTEHAKVTVIELADLADRVERDVMLTRYHVDADPGALGRISDSLAATCRAVQAADLTVIRVKVEHESQPSLPRYDAERYHEVHIKLQIPAERYEADYAWLREQGAVHGWRPSRNPRERRADHVMQFVTLRCYDGDRAAADARVAEVEQALSHRGLQIREIKRETTVLDTRREHDRWWA